MKVKFLLMSLLTLASHAFAAGGTYEVPVAEAELAPYATIRIGGISTRVSNGIMHISYRLPQDLVGSQRTQIELEGPVNADGTATLQGPLGDADCEAISHTGHSRGMICNISYHDLNLDPDRIAAEINERYASQPEVARKKEAVMRKFGFDGVGILRTR